MLSGIVIYELRFELFPYLPDLAPIISNIFFTHFQSLDGAEQKLGIKWIFPFGKILSMTTCNISK